MTILYFQRSWKQKVVNYDTGETFFSDISYSLANLFSNNRISEYRHRFIYENTLRTRDSQHSFSDGWIIIQEDLPIFYNRVSQITPKMEIVF